MESPGRSLATKATKETLINFSFSTTDTVKMLIRWSRGCWRRWIDSAVAARIRCAARW